MARFALIDDGNKQPSPQEQELAAEARYHEAAQHILRLPRKPGRRLLLGLLVELERIDGLALSPAQRFELLYPLQLLVRRVRPQLPKPTPNGPQAGAGLTLEQRLLKLMAINLKCLMRDLDRPRYLRQQAWDTKRRWAQTNLMAFLGRQIAYAAATARPVPAGTWQELHDLFVYLVVRTGLRIQQGGAKRRCREDHRFELAYKRLLLLGLALSVSSTRIVEKDLRHRLAGWAHDARLVEPDQFLGHDTLILVEVAKDQPPRWEPATLTDSFRGWVLSPPQAFLDDWERLRTPSPPFQIVAEEPSSMAA